MRLSVVESDPGYPAWILRQAYLRTFVTLNGVHVPEVVTADDERGELVRIARDEWGKLITNGDELAHELLRGVVRILPYHPDEPTNRGSTTGCRTSHDSRTGTGPQPDASPGSREAGTT